MKYFYDVLVNMNDERTLFFYEWDKNDDIIHLKKIPVFKTNTKDLKNMLLYNISVNESFLSMIHKKTETYDDKNKIIDYMALFTDSNSSIVLEFNADGTSICRSNLLLEEELDLIELSYSLKKEKINYTKKEKIIRNESIRQVEKLQNFLKIELDTLMCNKNILKMRYLYNEVTDKDESDINHLYKKLLDIIKSDFNESHLHLYDLIKLSYKHLSS